MIDLVQRSTIHGVNHIYSSKDKISKYFWLFLFVIGVCVICVNIVFVTKKFLSNPVILTYSLNHERFIWPDLTFCFPLNPFNFISYPDVLNHWNQVLNGTRDIAEILADKTQLFRIIHEQNKSFSELNRRTLAMATADPRRLKVDDIMSRIYIISYKKKHTGIYFFNDNQDKIKAKSMENWQDLFTTQFVQIRNNFPCHTFHIEKSKKSIQDKVQMLTFLLRFDYKSFEIFNSSYTHRSIWLYINNKNEIPKEPITLIPGFNNVIRLTQTRYLNSGLRRPCRTEEFKVHLYDALLQTTDEYEGDMDDCKKVVSQELFVRACHCYSPFLPIYKNESGFPRICLNATMFTKVDVLKNAQCMVKVYQQYRNKSDFNKIFHEKCKKYEPIKCDVLLYNINERKDMSVEMWTNTTNTARRHLLRFITQNFDFIDKNESRKAITSKIRDNLLWLQLRRETEFGDRYMEQSEYPFSELLSDIGGLMGLWLGMSVVGLFEVLQCWYLCIAGILCKHKKPINNSKTMENIDKTSLFLV